MITLLVMITHDILMHLFFKSIYYFSLLPLSYPPPSHNNQISCWLPLRLFRAHFLLTLPLAGSHGQQPSQRPPLSSMLLELVGSFPPLLDLILCSIQICWILPPGSAILDFHFLTLEVFCQTLWPFLFSALRGPLFLCWFWHPFTICPDFSLVITDTVLLWKIQIARKYLLILF